MNLNEKFKETLLKYCNIKGDPEQVFNCIQELQILLFNYQTCNKSRTLNDMESDIKNFLQTKSVNIRKENNENILNKYSHLLK